MTAGAAEPSGNQFDAVSIADKSYQWYKAAAGRSRIGYRLSETLLLAVAAAIPAVAAFSPHNATVPAILGAVVVVGTGMRTIFHWQDNYLRWSGAREAIKAERRRYFAGVAPYDDPTTRDQHLAAAVTRIEQEELAGWTKVAAERPKP